MGKQMGKSTGGSMKIKAIGSFHQKIIILLLMIGIIPVLIIGSVLFLDKINSEVEVIEENLILASNIESSEIKEFLKGNEVEVKGLAKNTILISETKKIIEKLNSKEDYFESQHKIMEQLKANLQSSSYIKELTITEPKSKTIIAHTNLKIPKIEYFESVHYQNAINGEISSSDIFSSNEFILNEYGVFEYGVPTMLVSSPMIGEAEIIGILTARVDVLDLVKNEYGVFEDIERKEFYLVNDEGYFLSKTKIENGKLINNVNRQELQLQIINPFTNQFTDIFQNKNFDQNQVNVEGYTNYQGIEVIGASSPIKGKDWMAIVEINKQEAYASIYQTQTFLITSIIAVIIGIVFTANHFARNLTQPIAKLKDATDHIKKGNLNVKVKTHGEKELQELAESFNSMANSLAESKRKEKKIQKKYENLYENSPTLNRTIDKNGIIIDCNKLFAEKLEYTKNEIIGTSIFKHTPYERIRSMRDSFEHWRKTGETNNHEVWLQTKNRKTFPVMISANNLYDEDGKLIGSNTVFKDISEYNKIKKVKEERDIIKIKIDHLKIIETQKNEFASMVSHELKSPLLPILGYCEFLQDKLTGELNDTQKEAVDEITKHAKRLELLIQDVLDVQRLDMKKLQFNKTMFNVGDLFVDLSKEYAPIGIEQKIQYRINYLENIQIDTDKERLKQIFDNLIRNSIDFVPKNGIIEIGGEQKNDEVIFYVKDNGCGIPKEKIGRLFKKFYQVDTTHTRKHGGTGLGLVVCKGIVEGLGGKIWVETEVGVGTTFFFSIPYDSKSKEELIINSTI